jgi:hypothetical protein
MMATGYSVAVSFSGHSLCSLSTFFSVNQF